MAEGIGVSDANRLDPRLLLDTGEWVRPLARRLLFDDENAADDLIQEAWICAIARSPRDATALRAWIRTTVRNIAHHVRRGEKRRRRREERAARPERVAPDDVVERLERHQALAAAVLALDEPYRTTVLHIFYDGLTVAALAEREGIREGTVRVRLHRALARLRRDLDRRHGGDHAQWMAALLPCSGLPIPKRISKQIAERLAAPSGAGGAGALGTAAVTAGIGSIIVNTKNIVVAGAIALMLGGGTAAVVWKSLESSREPADRAVAQRSLGAESETAALPSPPSRTPAEPLTPALAEAARDDDASLGESEEAPVAAPPGGAIHGLVIDEQGLPVAGAEVLAWYSPIYLLDQRSPTKPARAVTTAADGTFQIDGVPSDFVLSARTAERIARRRWHGNVLAGGRLDGVVLEVAPPTSIAGCVRDPEGRPVEAAAVRIEAHISPTQSIPSGTSGVFVAPAAPQSQTTDARGEYRFTTVLPEVHLARVHHADFETWHGKLDLAAPVPEITLVRGASLAGRIRDESGAPVANARVEVRQPAVPFGVLRAGESGADGRFEIRGIAPLERFTLMVHASEFAIHAEEKLRLPAAHEELEIVLEPAHPLAGRVVDAAGRPVAGAEVSITGDRVLDEGGSVMSPTPTWEYLCGIGSRLTAEDGSFEFVSLYDGEFEVVARSPGNSSLSVVMKARAGASDLVLVLDDAPAERAILRGTVVDVLRGEPITDFQVSVMRPARDPGAMTGKGFDFGDAAGRFEIPGLDPGRVALHVVALGYSPWNGPLFDLAAGVHEVAIEMAPARTLRLRALDRDGSPIANGRCSFLDDAGVSLLAEVGPGMYNSTLELDERGEGRAVGLPAARIVLRIVYRAGRAAGDFEVDLAREPTGVVELRIATPRSHVVQALVFSVESEPAVDPAGLERSSALWALERLTAAGDAVPIGAETRVLAENPEFGEIVLGTLTPDAAAGYRYHSAGVAGTTADPAIPVTLEPDTGNVTFHAPGHRRRTIDLGGWEETLGRDLIVVLLVQE